MFPSVVFPVNHWEIRGDFSPTTIQFHVPAAFCFSSSPNGAICPWKLHGNVVKCIFAFTYFLVLFSLIWFVLGHIWIVQRTSVFDHENSCKTNVSKVTVVILLCEYILGIWYLGSRLWNSPCVLRWLQATIQRRLGKFSDDNRFFWKHAILLSWKTV